MLREVTFSGLKVCVPSKFPSEILTRKVTVLGSEALGRWLGHDGRALMKEINAHKSSWSFLLCKDTAKSAIYEPKSGPSPDVELILNFPASKLCEMQLSFVYKLLSW